MARVLSTTIGPKTLQLNTEEINYYNQQNRYELVDILDTVF